MSDISFSAGGLNEEHLKALHHDRELPALKTFELLICIDLWKLLTKLYKKNFEFPEHLDNIFEF